MARVRGTVARLTVNGAGYDLQWNAPPKSPRGGRINVFPLGEAPLHQGCYASTMRRERSIVVRLKRCSLWQGGATEWIVEAVATGDTFRAAELRRLHPDAFEVLTAKAARDQRDKGRRR